MRVVGYPKTSSLNELSIESRTQYLVDMTLIGDAIIQVCKPLRINYSTLMNLDHYLHTHIETRYDWEPDEYISRPSYFYPKEQIYNVKYEYCEQNFGKLKRKITETLQDLMNERNVQK